MSKSETVEALAKIITHKDADSHCLLGERCAIAVEAAIYRNEIPGIAKQSHDGHSLWMCPKCERTRDGRGCLFCLEAERDALHDLVCQISTAIGCNARSDPSNNLHLIERAKYLGDQFTADRYMATERAVAERDQWRDCSNTFRQTADELGRRCQEMTTRIGQMEADMVTCQDRAYHLGHVQGSAQAKRDAMEAASLPVGGWVKCSERMPEIDVHVFVSGGIAVWRGGHWDSIMTGRAIEWVVDFWMPLPLPPKELKP